VFFLSLAVSPGDKLSAEVWAYYEAGSSYNTMIGVSGFRRGNGLGSFLLIKASESNVAQAPG
jgi:hypothetical protein